MKEIVVPAGAEAQKKTGAKLTNHRKALSAVAFVVAILAVLCVIGALVSVFVMEFGTEDEAKKILCTILACSFVGGAVAFALLAYLFTKVSQNALLQELDYRERCDSENSFFIGDGTLATFQEDHLLIHAEEGDKETVSVPYSEMRFFSVCTRHAPREKGEWSVVIEIPAHYLAKKGQSKPNDPPALVQTDAKERLSRCLQAHGLTLLGEERREGKSEKFTPKRKFIFPDRAARKRSLLFAAVGLVLVGGGIGLAFWQIMIGTLLAVFGVFVITRALTGFRAAKSMLVFYEEGVYWREKRSRENSAFLKWEEIDTVSQTEKEGVALLKLQCAYGAYHFPYAEGMLEYIREAKPEKCG